MIQQSRFQRLRIVDAGHSRLEAHLASVRHLDLSQQVEERRLAEAEGSMLATSSTSLTAKHRSLIHAGSDVLALPGRIFYITSPHCTLRNGGRGSCEEWPRRTDNEHHQGRLHSVSFAITSPLFRVSKATRLVCSPCGMALCALMARFKMAAVNKV